MNIRIKFVDECQNGAYGNTQVVDDKTILIQISREKNKKHVEFFVTVFHELLHAWMLILKGNGIKISRGREHKFIYAVQDHIVGELALLIKDQWRKRK